MTLEITDRADFKDKFASLMAANMLLINAGFPPSAELSSDIIDEFLNQFTISTPMPAIPRTAGYVVVANMTGWPTAQFRERLFDSEEAAIDAIEYWVEETAHGKASSYGVRKATYFA